MTGQLRAATVASLGATLEWLDEYPDWVSVREAYLGACDEPRDQVVEGLDEARRRLGRSDVSVRTGLALVRLGVPAPGPRVIRERRFPDVPEEARLPAHGVDGERCWTQVELIARSSHVGRVLERLQDWTLEVEDPLCRFSFRSSRGRALSSFAMSLLTWTLQEAGIDPARLQHTPRGVRVLARGHESPLAAQVAEHLTTPLPVGRSGESPS